jgi:hypothetical protein
MGSKGQEYSKDTLTLPIQVITILGSVRRLLDLHPCSTKVRGGTCEGKRQGQNKITHPLAAQMVSYE